MVAGARGEVPGAVDLETSMQTNCTSRHGAAQRHLTLAAMAAAFLAAVPVTAVAVVDQVSPVVDGVAFNVNAQGMDWQQEVVVGVGGQLVALELEYQFAQPFNQAQNFYFALYRGAGWHADPAYALITGVIVPTEGTLLLDLDAIGPSFAPGETFVFAVSGMDPNTDCCSLKGNWGAYAPGRLFFAGQERPYDIAFTTHMVPVPEPASGALLLAGLGWLARRRGAARTP
jgi:hypothetical protein